MRGLRGFLLATVSVATLSSTVLAADLPARMPVKAAPPAIMAWSWAGPYIGIHLGALWNDFKLTELGDNGGNLYAFPLGTEYGPSASARFSGGGQIGYNFQSGSVVYGLEADLSWGGGKRSTTILTQFVGPAIQPISTSVDWMGTVRGRLGVTLSPTLLYVTGGLAVAHFNDTLGNAYGFSPADFSSSKTRAGWTAGGGIEHMFTRNWSGKIEALYADFGDWVVSSPAGISGSYRTRFAHEVVTVRGGLNWKW